LCFRSLLESREDIRYNLEIVDVLVRSHLINLAQIDGLLAQAMDNGNNFLAVSFSMQLVQLYLIDDRNSSITESDLYNVIEMLFRISVSGRQAPDGLTSLIEVLRTNQEHNLFSDRASGGPTAHIHSGILQAREFDDPQGLLEKTEYLLREWVSIYHSPTASRDPTKAFSVFVHQV
jgi:CCR4-NOT transcription complex subunit 1